MAFHLKNGEAAGEGLERILREQFGRIESDAAGAGAVHAMRKRCKRVRAAIRLLEPKRPRFFRGENKRFRALARRLAGFRDAEVRGRMLDELAREAGGGKMVAGLRRRLPLAMPAGRNDLAPVLAEAKAAARAARNRLAEADIKGAADFAWIEDGLRKSYDRGRKAMAVALRRNDERDFHEWRKRVKDLGYQLQVARPIWPAVLKGWQQELEALGELLGDDHDRAGLREEIRKAGLSAEAKGLLAQLSARMLELRAQAKRLGERIYREKPKAFLRRLRRYRKISSAKSTG